MYFAKSKKIKYAFILVLLFIAIAGLWLLRSNFKFFADSTGDPTYSYIVNMDKNEYSYSDNVIIIPDNPGDPGDKMGLLTTAPITNPAEEPKINSIYNFSELTGAEKGEFQLIKGGTPTNFSSLANDSSVIEVLNTDKASFDSKNNVHIKKPSGDNKSFNKPIVFSVKSVSIPSKSLVKSISLATTHNISTEKNKGGGWLQTTVASNPEVAKKFLNYCYLEIQNSAPYDCSFSYNYGSSGEPQAWTAEDMSNLYVAVLPASNQPEYWLSSLKVKIEYVSVNDSNNSGIVTLNPTFLETYNSKSPLTSWKKFQIEKVYSIKNSVAKIQWYAGDLEKVKSDMAKGKILDGKNGECQSDCSNEIIVPDNIMGGSFVSYIKNSKNKPPVGRYGGFIVKFWVGDSASVAPQIYNKFTVSYNAPTVICPSNISFTGDVTAGKILTLKGKNLKSGDQISIKSTTTGASEIKLLSNTVTSSNSINGKVPLGTPAGYYYVYVNNSDCAPTQADGILNIKAGPPSTCPENIKLEKDLIVNTGVTYVKVTGSKFDSTNTVKIKNTKTGKIYDLSRSFQSAGQLTATFTKGIDVGTYEFYVVDNRATCDTKEVKAGQLVNVSATAVACPTITSVTSNVGKNGKRYVNKGSSIILKGNNFSSSDSLSLVSIVNDEPDITEKYNIVGAIVTADKTKESFKMVDVSQDKNKWDKKKNLSVVTEGKAEDVMSGAVDMNSILSQVLKNLLGKLPLVTVNYYADYRPFNIVLTPANKSCKEINVETIEWTRFKAVYTLVFKITNDLISPIP